VCTKALFIELWPYLGLTLEAKKRPRSSLALIFFSTVTKFETEKKITFDMEKLLSLGNVYLWAFAKAII
jgi:hypothetical protein